MQTTNNFLTPERLAASVEHAILNIACELRPDYLCALQASLATERNERARHVLTQLLDNAAIAKKNRVPLCQDTGYVWVLLEVWGDMVVPANIFSGINEAVAKAYSSAGLRKSLVRDALLDRTNTKDNTPAFCELSFVASPLETSNVNCQNQATDHGNGHRTGAANSGSGACLHVMLKGGGSDNASCVHMLAPGAGIDGVRKVVVDAVLAKARNACPPLVVGVGIGGSFDKVPGLAKRALLRNIVEKNSSPESQMSEPKTSEPSAPALRAPEPKTSEPSALKPKSSELAALELELLAKINASNIGPGGFGGDTTALAVHINTAPCHIAALPVAINIGCCAMRSVSINL
ncbi:MAG: fumarate hydratase [Coriobacteriales bacterium]|jgi:tartrate dehydratase alpha subunit/fumarate hydratase class I-like protein|nr:fumarate hydratase [Coriobacteriales bacterium]